MVPPKTGGDAAGGKEQNIPRIGDADVQKQRADDLAHHRPDGEVQKHFPPAWRPVMFAQSAQPLQPEHDGQGGRHQQKVIKVRMQKWPDPVKMCLEKMAQMRPNNEPVENVCHERNPKQTVMEITEPPHNASSANPEVIASNVLKSKIIFWHFTPLNWSRQKEFGLS